MGCRRCRRRLACSTQWRTKWAHKTVRKCYRRRVIKYRRYLAHHTVRRCKHFYSHATGGSHGTTVQDQESLQEILCDEIPQSLWWQEEAQPQNRQGLQFQSWCHLPWLQPEVFPQ